MSTVCNCHGMIYLDCPNRKAKVTPSDKTQPPTLQGCLNIISFLNCCLLSGERLGPNYEKQVADFIERLKVAAATASVGPTKVTELVKDHGPKIDTTPFSPEMQRSVRDFQQAKGIPGSSSVREAQDDERTIWWRPEVEPLRRMMMEKFSDTLSMEEIARRCYRAAEIINPEGISAQELAEQGKLPNVSRLSGEASGGREDTVEPPSDIDKEAWQDDRSGRMAVYLDTAKEFLARAEARTQSEQIIKCPTCKNIDKEDRLGSIPYKSTFYCYDPWHDTGEAQSETVPPSDEPTVSFYAVLKPNETLEEIADELEHIACQKPEPPIAVHCEALQITLQHAADKLRQWAARASTGTREIKADTLFGIYTGGTPMTLPNAPQPIYWEGWQRIADWLNNKASEPQIPSEEKK